MVASWMLFASRSRHPWWKAVKLGDLVQKVNEQAGEVGAWGVYQAERTSWSWTFIGFTGLNRLKIIQSFFDIFDGIPFFS